MLGCESSPDACLGDLTWQEGLGHPQASLSPVMQGGNGSSLPLFAKGAAKLPLDISTGKASCGNQLTPPLEKMSAGRKRAFC